MSPRWMTVGVVAMLLLVGVVVRTATSEPPTLPRSSDVENSERVLPASPAEERSDAPQVGFVAGNGIVEPADRETKVAGAVGGRIARIAVSEGTRVAAGAVLVELESEAERAGLAGAEAEVAVARAELARAQKGLRVEDVEAIVADAQASRARAELASSTAARAEVLARKGATTADELDRAVKQAAIDRSGAEAAEARARAARAGSRAEDIAVARARVSAAEARRLQAAAVLERLLVRAPIDGEVLASKYRAGEFYSPGGEALIVLGDTRKLRVRMDVDERDVGKVAAGAEAFVTLSAQPGTRIRGRVVEIGRRMGRKNLRTDDPVERIDTKVLEVLIELEGAKGLVPGLRVMSYVRA